MRVPWTARRSNQSILKEISPGISLEGMMLKLKLQYFKSNPYDYTVEVRNRFKGLDLIDSVPDELWNEVHDIVQETGIKTIPKKKKCKKAKWLSGEALQIALKRREAKSKGEKERYIHLNAEFQRIARRDKKAYLNDQCKENRGKQ